MGKPIHLSSDILDCSLCVLDFALTAGDLGGKRLYLSLDVGNVALNAGHEGA